MSTTVEPSPFVDKPTLTGHRAILRPFVLDDVAAMAEAIADPEVGRLTGSVNSSSVAPDEGFDEERLRQWYGSRAGQTDRLDLAIVYRATGECVGEVVLNEWEPENASCNFRILIGPRGRDRDALRFDGEWVDSHLMSVLAPEWEQHRGRPALA